MQRLNVRNFMLARALVASLFPATRFTNCHMHTPDTTSLVYIYRADLDAVASRRPPTKISQRTCTLLDRVHVGHVAIVLGAVLVLLVAVTSYSARRSRTATESRAVQANIITMSVARFFQRTTAAKRAPLLFRLAWHTLRIVLALLQVAPEQF